MKKVIYLFAMLDNPHLLRHWNFISSIVTTP